jgi:hypothetical protein
MPDYCEYGTSGAGQRRTIDKYLDHLSINARVLYVGLGDPRFNHLRNLSRKLTSPASPTGKHLIAVDVNQGLAKALDHHMWRWSKDCQRITSPLCADACAMALKDESIDLILALGLFGGLSYKEDCGSAFGRVLGESLRVLLRGGFLLIGNAGMRLPVEQFAPMATDAGFETVECTAPTRTVRPQGSPGNERRYLLVLRKP